MKRRSCRILPKLVLFTISMGFFVVGTGLLWATTLQLPDFNTFTERKVAESTKIYDRTGKVLLYDVGRDLRRTVIPISEMGNNIRQATVAIEDANFYDHNGIEPKAVLRALLTNVASLRASQGGSTITQQVVKNTLLTADKQFTRKIKEAVLALKLEQVLNKDQILELYLNEAPYGGSIYGIEEASQSFFGVHTKDLSLAQASYLAALPQAPTYYSPYGNHRDALEGRRLAVLRRMIELGMIDADKAKAAKTEKVIFVPQSERSIKAPHFVMYVRALLEKEYGADIVETGGLRVTTTLDWKLEQLAEETVRSFGEDNARKYNASNAGLVALDPKTGQILAMVGSRDYFNEKIDGNVNVALTHRQPGSSFKPFVYATAFKKGYTPDTVVFDLKTQFDTSCPADANVETEDRCYAPENFDEQFRGPMSLRSALAQSINVPAIKVLYLAGIKDSIATAQSLGVQGLSDPDRYGLTLVLGGGEVSLLDMTGAYSVFANEGVRNAPTAILKVEGKGGVIYESYTPNPSFVLDAEVTRKISDILSDNAARAPSYGVSSPLFIPGRDVAVKTGTTNDYRDAWIIGYAPNLAVGVWSGNNDNSPMEKKVAGFIVAPIWHEFMTKALPTFPKEYFLTPEATPEESKPVLRGVWQNPEGIHEILHWVNKGDPIGPPPAHPESDPQYSLWERPVERWLKSQHVSATSSPANTN